MEIYVLFVIFTSFNNFVSVLPEIGKQMYDMKGPM